MRIEQHNKEETKMMKKETIMKTMRLWKCAGIVKPVRFRSVHRNDYLPMKYEHLTCHTKDDLAMALFDLSIYDWGICGLRYCGGYATIVLENCVDWKGKHRDTNIDADVVQSIMGILEASELNKKFRIWKEKYCEEQRNVPK